MEGYVPLLFLMVVLKIPVAALLYLIWWAVRAVPEPDEIADGGEHGFHRWHSSPRRPKGPRRGPHAPDAVPLPACPPGGRAREVKRSPLPRVAPARAGSNEEALS